MKKTAAAMTVLAAAGFTGLAMTPASAAPFAFDNCSHAAQYGVYNIPVGMPGYGPHLDSDLDGIGCENSSVGYDSHLVPSQTGDGELTHEIVDRVPESWDDGGYHQVGQVPAGAADTGVEGDSVAPGLAVAGGLTLAAAAGVTVAARRRARA